MPAVKSHLFTQLSTLTFRFQAVTSHTQPRVTRQWRTIHLFHQQHQKAEPVTSAQLEWHKETECEVKVKTGCLTNENAPPHSLPDFNDHHHAYRSKTLFGLIRGFTVFQLCSVDALVDRQLQILTWCRRLLGKRLFVWLMKKTLYGHFMGGETRDEIFRQIEHNAKYGVHPMIAFTAAETHGDTDRSDGDSGIMKKFYADCLLAVEDSLEIAHGMRELSPDVPLVSSKLTFIKPHKIFGSFSALISHNREFIRRCQLKEEVEIESRDFGDLVIQCVRQNNSKASFQSANMSMNFHLQLYQHGSQHFPSYKEGLELVKLDVDGIIRTADTMEKLGQKAENLGVILIWDAEQTYLQTAMDVFTLDSMRFHNKHRAVIHGTYQCYLKNGFEKLIRDTDLAALEGFCWGGKVVRGAYMDEERRLASLHGYEDPVNPTYEATTEMYHRVVDKILTLMMERNEGAVNVTVATHNVDTVTYILNSMADIGFTAERNFRFAQLLGMRDNITFCLGHHSVPVAKLVHYGPVEDCVAYLSRRVKENRSGIDTANLERGLLKQGILARMRQE